MTIAAWIWVAALILGCIMFFVYSRTGKFIRCLLFTAITGAGALGLLWILGHFFPVSITITPLSLFFSTIFGIPGVAGMLLLFII